MFIRLFLWSNHDLYSCIFSTSSISASCSLPSEVCTVISDADCITPVQTICNAASPTPDCQMILRQFFNDSGVFCLNVSLTNDVSLAMASARVSVSLGELKQNKWTASKNDLILRLFSSHLFNVLHFQPLQVHQLELLLRCSVSWFSPVSSAVLVWCTGD